MLVAAAPCALLWPAAMMVWGPGFTASRHGHHCVQLVMALEKDLRIRGGARQRWIRCGAALVRPDAQHEVDATSTHVLLAFVDAESDLGGGLLERMESDLSIVPDATVASWRRCLGNPLTLDGPRVESWVRKHLLPVRRTPKLHPGVRRALRVLREQIGSEDDFSLQRMAALAELSPSRFMHVFTESVGIPLRPYIRWLRVQIACGELMRGASAAEAAYRSGFSDAAHLTRTLRHMLGMTPRELTGRRSSARAAFPSSSI